MYVIPLEVMKKEDWPIYTRKTLTAVKKKKKKNNSLVEHIDNIDQTDYVLYLVIHGLWMITAMLIFKFLFYYYPKEQSKA